LTAYLDGIDLSAIEPSLRNRFQQEIIGPALSLLAKEGYQVKVSRDLNDLKRFWASHKEADDLYQCSAFDAAFHPPGTPVQGLFLEKGNAQVGTVWCRLVRLLDPRTLRSLTLKQALEELYVFYHDPDDAPRREKCIVDCEIAEDIKRCTVCYGGALWIDKQNRGGGLLKAFSQLSRTLSFTGFAEPWHWFMLLTEDRNRVLALDHFPCTSYTRGVTHKGIHNWLCTATYQDAIRLALKAA
jgi:hypothetical protein